MFDLHAIPASIIVAMAASYGRAMARFSSVLLQFLVTLQHAFAMHHNYFASSGALR